MVESQRDNRKKGKCAEYFVPWESYPDEEGTCKTYNKVKGIAEEALPEFSGKNPNPD